MLLKMMIVSPVNSSGVVIRLASVDYNSPHTVIPNSSGVVFPQARVDYNSPHIVIPNSSGVVFPQACIIHLILLLFYY